MSAIILDFESRSHADLTEIGGRLYWEAPSTEAIVCVLHEVESGGRVVWYPGDPCPFGPDDVLVAHNAMGFDRFGAARVGWRALDDGPPWIDTSEIARVAGLPGALDALAKRWLGREKNHAGNAVTRRLSGIKAPLQKKRTGTAEIEWSVPPDIVTEIKAYEQELKRTGKFPPISPVLLDYVTAYCGDDVDVLVHGWPELIAWADADLPGVSAADRAINDRGIRFDRELANALLREDERMRREASVSCAIALGGAAEDAAQVADAARSPKQFCEITGAENAQAETVRRIDHPLARLRLALATIAAGKLTKGLLRTSADGRMRDCMRYFGAHTGRWSGRGMQLQNMPRPDKRFEEWGDAEVCALAERVIAGGHCDQAELDLLVRACLVPEPGNVLVWGDYSAVEGRFLAWAAEDESSLDMYRRGLDPYKVAAAEIFGVPYDQVTKAQRQVGKVAILALGYGGGEGAFANMAQGLGVDLTGLDVPSIVRAWRDAHPATTSWWYELQRAMITCAQTREPVTVSRRYASFQFCPGPHDSVAVILPSGRPVVYWGVKVEADHMGRPAATYDGQHFRVGLYGGLLAENLTQAGCRDLLADALARIEAGEAGPCAGVLHVHDEPVAECAARDEAAVKAGFGRVLTTLPAWAEGFPPKAEVASGRRYRK